MRWSRGGAGSKVYCTTHEGTFAEFAAQLRASAKVHNRTMAEYHGLSKLDQGEAKAGPWVSGAVYRDGYRSLENVEERTILTVDIDDISPGAASQILGGNHGWLSLFAHVAHTTLSSTPEKPRLRLYVAIDHPVCASDYRLLAAKFCTRLEADFTDPFTGEQELICDRPASTDPARLMYVPTWCSDARQGFYVGGTGVGIDLIDLDDIEVEAPEPPKPTVIQPSQSPDLDSRAIELLQAAGAVIVPSPRRKSELTTNCPWHDDQSPSLDIAPDGRMVCRAGCKPGGQPITWLRYVQRVLALGESQAFRWAEGVLGVPRTLPPQVTAEAFDQLSDKSGESCPPRGPNPFGFVHVRDLPVLRINPQDRIWGDILTRGCVTVLAGQAGIGKSTATRQLAAAVAAGEAFLGRDAGKRATVLVVDWETPEVYRRSAWGEIYGDESLSSLDVAIYIATMPVGLNAESWRALAAFAGDVGADLVVVDTISAAFSVENENDNAQMEQVARVLRDIARSGPAVLAIAHPSKGGADIRGASSLQGAVDTVVTFKAVSQQDVFDETTEFALTVKKNRVGATGTSKLVWDGRGGWTAPLEDTVDEACNSRRVVVEIIGQASGPIVVETVLRKAAQNGVSKRSAERALKQLVEAGEITRPRRGEYQVTTAKKSK